MHETYVTICVYNGCLNCFLFWYQLKQLSMECYEVGKNEVSECVLLGKDFKAIKYIS